MEATCLLTSMHNGDTKFKQPLYRRQCHVSIALLPTCTLCQKRSVISLPHGTSQYCQDLAVGLRKHVYALCVRQINLWCCVVPAYIFVQYILCFNEMSKRTALCNLEADNAVVTPRIFKKVDACNVLLHKKNMDLKSIGCHD